MTSTRQWLAALAVLGIAAAIGAVSMLDPAPDVRSVQPLSLVLPDPADKFDSAQSAALFVGVREFDGDVFPVPYAVDDAVDLAYAFSLGGKSGLVTPGRVVLALSGIPQKKESGERLQKLRAAGATITSATAEELRSLLRRQLARVTSGGILIVSFATHGFLGDDGTHYLLGSQSTFEPETSLSAVEVQDIASRAPRSLLLVDACRERVPSASRAGDNGPRSTAPYLRSMSRARGQVVLYAAAPGEYAFDDVDKQQGVFTRAVLDGLACKGTTAPVVTVDRLFRFVNQRVKKWVQTKKRGRGGIQISMDDDTRLMPLADCRCGVASPPADTWRSSVHAPVVRSEIIDLDGDCADEVVVNAGGVLHVFDTNGGLRWKVGKAIRSFVIGAAYRDRREVLALSGNGFSTFDDEGNPLARVPGPLQNITLYRPTKLYGNRIIATSGDVLLLFKSKDPVPVWRRRVPGRIESVELSDYDKDDKLDLVVHTTEERVVLDVDAHCLNGAKVLPLPRK